MISDAHANPQALRRILADAEARSDISCRIFLGDALGYGDDPLGVLEQLAAFDVLIAGNHETEAIERSHLWRKTSVDGRWKYDRQVAKLQRTLPELRNPAALRFISGFVSSHERDGCLFFHGVPGCNRLYPFNEIDIAEQLKMYPEHDIFFGGHLHIPRLAIWNRASHSVEFAEIHEPLSAFELDLLNYRYFVNCPAATNGRLGYRRPGYCLFSRSSSRALLAFHFLSERD